MNCNDAGKKSITNRRSFIFTDQQFWQCKVAPPIGDFKLIAYFH